MKRNNLKLITAAVFMAVSQMSQASSLPILVSGPAGVGLIGDYDVAMGENAGNNSNGSSNTLIAVNAGIGLIGNSNNVIGANAGRNLVGNGNAIFGDSTGRNVQGSSNSIFGTGISCSYQCFNVQEVIGSSNALFGNPSFTKIYGNNNIGFGTFAGSVAGDDNVSIGSNSGPGMDQFLNPRSVSSSVSLGAYATARADGSVALGANSLADVANTISVGGLGFERRIMNVGDAVLGTDAVNLRQVQGLIGAISINPAPVVIPNPTPQPSTPITGIDIGPDYTAVGIGAIADQTNLALGTNVVAKGSNTAAIGNGSTTLEGDTNLVSFGDAESGLTRRLTNLSDGYLNSDAATVGQVNHLFNSIVGLIPVHLDPVETPVPVFYHPTDINGNTNVGDGAGLNSSGSNNTNVGLNAGVTNVGDNDTFLGNNSGSTDGHSTNAVAIGNGAKSGTNGVALGAGSVAANGTVSVGSVGAERQIKNVAAGTESTDVVNLAQLSAVANAANLANQSNADGLNALNSKIDSGISSVRREIRDVAKRSYGGTALALAISNGTPAKPGEAQVQVGLGSFNGESAIAVSTSMSTDEGTIVSLGGGFTTQGDIGVRAGVSFTFNPTWLK